MSAGCSPQREEHVNRVISLSAAEGNLASIRIFKVDALALDDTFLSGATPDEESNAILDNTHKEADPATTAERTIQMSFRCSSATPSVFDRSGKGA